MGNSLLLREDLLIPFLVTNLAVTRASFQSTTGSLSGSITAAELLGLLSACGGSLFSELFPPLFPVDPLAVVK
jgi:hypothetical protein